MRIATFIVLLSFADQAHAKDKLIEKLTNKLWHSSIDLVDLDKSTLGKPGKVAVSPPSLAAPRLQRPSCLGFHILRNLPLPVLGAPGYLTGMDQRFILPPIQATSEEVSDAVNISSLMTGKRIPLSREFFKKKDKMERRPSKLANGKTLPASLRGSESTSSTARQRSTSSQRVSAPKSSTTKTSAAAASIAEAAAPPVAAPVVTEETTKPPTVVVDKAPGVETERIESKPLVEKVKAAAMDLLGPKRAAETTRAPPAGVELKSGCGMDYTPLKELLEMEKFEAADDETRALLIKLAGEGAVDRGWVYFLEVKSIPVEDMKTIDQLWKAYSNDKFGYSVQRRIWEREDRQWDRLLDKIGWMRPSSSGQELIFRRWPDQFTYNSSAVTGHLPLTNHLRGSQLHLNIFQHPAFMKPGSDEEYNARQLEPSLKYWSQSESKD